MANKTTKEKLTEKLNEILGNRHTVLLVKDVDYLDADWLRIELEHLGWLFEESDRSGFYLSKGKRHVRIFGEGYGL